MAKCVEYSLTEKGKDLIPIYYEKKTQPMKPGGGWVHGLWGNMVYVSVDVDKNHQA